MTGTVLIYENDQVVSSSPDQRRESPKGMNYSSVVGWAPDSEPSRPLAFLVPDTMSSIRRSKIAVWQENYFSTVIIKEITGSCCYCL